MYAEFEVHRTMICDRVRTGAFRRAIESVVRPGDIVLDVGVGSGILSVFAARAGAARVYAVERTSAAVLARELAAANGVAEVVRVIHGDVTDVELPERVDVIVSEWLGGFGIDEGMLVPVIVARDRWLKPGGVMIPRLVMAWAALVHDRYLGDVAGAARCGHVTAMVRDVCSGRGSGRDGGWVPVGAAAHRCAVFQRHGMADRLNPVCDLVHAKDSLHLAHPAADPPLPVGPLRGGGVV